MLSREARRIGPAWSNVESKCYRVFVFVYVFVCACVCICVCVYVLRLIVSGCDSVSISVSTSVSVSLSVCLCVWVCVSVFVSLSFCVSLVRAHLYNMLARLTHMPASGHIWWCAGGGSCWFPVFSFRFWPELTRVYRLMFVCDNQRAS